MPAGWRWDGVVRPTSRLLVVTLIVVGLLWQASFALGQVAAGATVTVLRGTVSVSRADGTAVMPASSGLVLGVGDTVATVGRSSALVTFFDGSEIELGADTAIVIQNMQAGSAGEKTILIKNVVGSTVHRIVALATPGSSYRIEANGTVTDVRGTTLGHRVDEDGNVTVYLIDSNGNVMFPTSSYFMRDGEVCTWSVSGDLVCASANGENVWNVLANGVFGNQAGGTGNQGALTGSQPNNKPRDDHDSRDGGPTPTATATATATPEGRLTPTDTATPTPTTTPTVTSTTNQPPCALLVAGC
ncbi:MAG: FecR domain-containing protein [Chloroflexi bacterium]|nr:FecR domain-containing protein [Chloroflexota bacterium]